MHEWITEWYLVVTSETSQGEEIIGLDTSEILPIVAAVAVGALGIFAVIFAARLIKRALRASAGPGCDAETVKTAFRDDCSVCGEPGSRGGFCPSCRETHGEPGVYNQLIACSVCGEYVHWEEINGDLCDPCYERHKKRVLEDWEEPEKDEEGNPLVNPYLW